MRHVSADRLVDIAEGAGVEPPHLRECARCRRQLDELRAALSAAAAADVPEPSPAFWEHLSARVHDAANAADGRRARWRELIVWRVTRPALAGALAVIFAAAFWTARALAPTGARPAAPAPAAAGASRTAVPSPDDQAADPMLDLVAELAAQMDWESVSQMAVGAQQGGVDEAFAALTDVERRQAHALLEELQ
ncbi:MAG: hypothetical protein IT176_10235 [Acidobacteria bacterium]|nr:hypothetical protein [Acidobacteriota bacterium]